MPFFVRSFSRDKKTIPSAGRVAKRAPELNRFIVKYFYKLIEFATIAIRYVYH